MQEVLNKNERIEVIDVMRGFTLLGIAMVHFTEQYYAGMMPGQQEATISILDGIVMGFVQLFISGKFYMIFSFLFGLSFFIQLRNSDGQKIFFARFSWRLIVLFLIGLIHSLHYRGDILTIYAGLGFGLLICYRLPDRALLIIALLLVFNVPSAVTKIVDLIKPAAEGAPSMFNMDQGELQNYYNTVKSGTYFDILKLNFHELAGKLDFQIMSGRLYITMGLFLLGLYVGRKNTLSNIAFIKKLIPYALWTILGCIIFMALFFGGTQLAGVVVPQPVMWLVAGTALDIFNTALATIYVALIITLFQKEKWKNRLMVFYSVGRMGLTTYLMQTLFGMLIFFSIGLGLLGELSQAICFLIGIAVFTIQIFISNFWLKRFLYGPAEWFWRSLTYLKIQPMRKR